MFEPFNILALRYLLLALTVRQNVPLTIAGNSFVGCALDGQTSLVRVSSTQGPAPLDFAGNIIRDNSNAGSLLFFSFLQMPVTSHLIRDNILINNTLALAVPDAWADLAILSIQVRPPDPVLRSISHTQQTGDFAQPPLQVC